MISRRELIAAGMAGGVAASHVEAVPAAVGQQPDAQTRAAMEDIAENIESVEGTLRRAFLNNSLSHGVIGEIRKHMITFCRSNQKFPDFMEVGLGVFIDLYDWHVKNRQQLVVTRSPDGRYWLQFMFTSMVLRPEVDLNYVGIPYDKG